MALSVQEKLDDARRAYHQLVTGQMARVVVDQNGERVEFTATNRQALWAYIAQLEAELNSQCPPTSSGPIGFLF